jgi:hypothetical protein
VDVEWAIAEKLKHLPRVSKTTSGMGWVEAKGAGAAAVGAAVGVAAVGVAAADTGGATVIKQALNRI